MGFSFSFFGGGEREGEEGGLLQAVCWLLWPIFGNHMIFFVVQVDDQYIILTLLSVLSKFLVLMDHQQIRPVGPH